jgi:hypothetical protein
LSTAGGSPESSIARRSIPSCTLLRGTSSRTMVSSHGAPCARQLSY